MFFGLYASTQFRETQLSLRELTVVAQRCVGYESVGKSSIWQQLLEFEDSPMFFLVEALGNNAAVLHMNRSCHLY